MWFLRSIISGIVSNEYILQESLILKTCLSQAAAFASSWGCYIESKAFKLSQLGRGGFLYEGIRLPGSACLDLPQDLAPSIHSHSALDPSPVFHFAAAFLDEVLVWF